MVSTTLVECLWKWEMCDVKFLFFFAADTCTYSHILGYFYLLIFFCSFGHLLAMKQVCHETTNILCLFWWFFLSNISMGLKCGMWYLCESKKTLIFWMFCISAIIIWFCAILHLILCNILHYDFCLFGNIFFIFVAVQHYRFKNFYLFIFCILHSAYPNLRRYSFLVALLVLYLCKWLSMYL